MYRKLVFVSLVLCLMIFGGTSLAFAGQADREAPGANLLEKMNREGWRPVAEGVLQRTRGGDDKVESFAYGKAGFEWLEQELLRQYEKMKEEYAAYPSRKLARQIERQKREILRIQKALRNNEVPSSQEKAIVNGCDVTYGAHADAYYLTNVQGVGASADAYFSANCGAPGHTEAFIYVRATLNGTTSTHSINDPSDSYYGEYVSSNASWTLQGGPDCYSQASSSVTSVQLGISYSVFDENYLCPPPPLKVTITGPLSASITGYNCKSLLWSASAMGGVPGYSYAWYRNGSYVGSGSSYSEYLCGSNITWTEYINLSVTVTDSVSAQASDPHSTTVYYYRNTTTCDQYDPYKSAALPYCPLEPY